MEPLVEPTATEIDGLPTFFVDVETPFVATLAVRASKADEPLSRAGLTHLVEHLAMPIDEVHGVEANASVQPGWTLFWAAGPPESVAEQLAALAANLRDLPIDRFETERKILLTESSGRGVPSGIALGYMLRFGARGYGLLGHDEPGLQALTAEDAAAWAASYFTRDNAVLWTTGRPPERLALELPRGEPRLPPRPEPIPYLELPCVYEAVPGDDVVLTMLADRSADLALALAVAERRLRRDLRYESGLSYSVDVVYEPLTKDAAHVSIAADTLEANAAGVRDGLIRTLRELAATGVTEEEIARHVEQVSREFRDPHSSPQTLFYAATAKLLGADQQSLAELLAEYERATAASTAAAVERALETALLLTPEESSAPEGFAPYPLVPPRSVTGKRHPLRGFRVRRRRDEPVLVAGADGVAIEAPTARTAVRFDECEIVLRNGASRTLWSSDGFFLEVDPEAWRGGDEVVALIDRTVPPELHVAVDPAREERERAVSGAAAGRVKRSWLTSDELDALPDLLGPGEDVRLVVRADRGWRTGVLAVTERRVLFLYLTEVVVEIPLDAIREVRTGGGFYGKPDKVTIHTDDAKHKFTDIKGGDAEGVAAELRSRPNEHP